MIKSMISSRSVADHALWEKILEKRSILQFRIEMTACCNNNCRHCYICLPADDRAAQESEPTFQEIMDIADQAVKMGALWCTITGGEPLIRDDFPEVYTGLCIECPAHAYLEKGSMDAQVPYFCQVAHARPEALGYGKKV